MLGGAETQHECHHADKQENIDLRHIDLADFFGRGVLDQQARDKSQLHGLGSDGKGTRNHRLRSNDGRHGGQKQQGNQRPIGGQSVKRVIDSGWFVDQQGALAEVIEQQAGKYQVEPGALDRRASEVPHVGIKGLTAGHCEDDRAQDRNGYAGVVGQKQDAGDRVQGGKNARGMNHLSQAHGPQGREPDKHHRAEYFADDRGAKAFHRKQAGDQNQ